MLEKFREGSQGTAAKVILGLVILSFALAGVGSYVATPQEPLAAKINGEEISRAEFDQAYQNERARMEAQFGETFNHFASDPAYMAQFRRNVLDRMINERLIDQAANRLGVRASDAQVRAAIRSMPEFQIDGEFDTERYQSAIFRAGYQHHQFRELIRGDLSRQQLQFALLGSEFALPAEARQLLELNEQKRDVSSVTLSLSKFRSEDPIDDARLEEYYQQRKDSLLSDEAVDLQYILVDGDALIDGIEVTDAQIEEQYQATKNNYVQAEKRRVAHILFTGDDAQARAEEVLAKLAAGEEFAALAESESDDTFSGQNGGELDWFERGVMDPAFEDAAFALSEDDALSAAVESAFGVHIIKLLEVQAEQASPLDEVKDEIREQLAKRLATDNYYQQAQQLSELAFELPDSLDEVAGETGLELITVEGFTRANAQGELASPIVFNQVFDRDFIAEGLNSEALQLTDTKSLVVRVNKFHPAEVKPLSEVKEQLIEELRIGDAEQAAQDFAAELVELLTSEQDLAELLASKSLSLEENTGLTRTSVDYEPAVMNHIFSMAKPIDSAVVSQASSMTGDIIVLKLNSVTDAEYVSETQLDEWLGRLSDSKLDSGMRLLIDVLRNQADIKELL